MSPGRKLFRDALSVVAAILPMSLAAAAVAVPIGLLARSAHWPWYLWLVLLPSLYSVWLVSYMLLSAWTCAQMGKRFPKPRFYAAIPGANATKDALPLATAVVCYRRSDILNRLPLVNTLQQAEILRDLTFRAYSPSVSIGPASVVSGKIEDPDLTTVGAGVMLGSASVVVAHSISVRPDGAFVYASAPIRIEDRATVGGSARIAMGVTIGTDSVVEPGAIVEPFTTIPAGEVWGGNPARFRRKRDGITSCPAAEAAIPSLSPQTASSALLEEARQIVCSALRLPAGSPVSELSADDCDQWDSLGQVAIASAVFDRYGKSIPPAEIYRIQSVEQLAAFLGNNGHPVPADPPRAIETPKDPEMLPLLDPGVATAELATRFAVAPSGARPVPVVVSATFTAQPLASPARLWGRAFGFDLSFEFAGFNQIAQTLLDPESPFARNVSGVNLVLVRPEDLSLDAPEQAEAQLDQLCDAAQHFARVKPRESLLLVGALPPVVSSSLPFDPNLVDDLRTRWRSRLSAVPGLDFLEFGRVVERLGAGQAYDPQNEILSRAPYSPRLYQDLGIEFVRSIRAARTSPAKVIVLDCDNTLWGGVLGEVGFFGIEIGPDGPGRAFHLFQKRLKALQDRGILLAVVSKNELPDVEEVFKRHPGMVLRPADIAVWRVNWRHKSENLIELAAELHLGLDSFVFVDDDPAVRGEVEARSPEVHVVPMPPDPARFCETLDRLWLFDNASSTAVDASRTRMMQEESARRKGRERSVSLEGFLSSLQLRVTVERASEDDLPRVAQLTQRTNQFNTTLRRRTLDEIRAVASESTIFVLNAADKFGDYGLVGAAILRPGARPESVQLETLLMSCRALGRGVEDALLSAIAGWAAAERASVLEAPFSEGPRNSVARDFLLRSGFREVAPGNWEIAVSQTAPLPGHVQLTTGLVPA